MSGRARRESPRSAENGPAEVTPLIQADVPPDSDSDQEVERWESNANKTFNSLDFDEVENELLVESRRRDPYAHEPSSAKQWVIIVLIGVLTAAVAAGIDKGIEGLMTLKFDAVTKYMHTTTTATQRNVTEGNVTRTETVYSTEEIPFTAPFFIFLVINLAYVSIAAALVIFGEPVARGSGIGEIKCYLNGIRIFRVVRFKTLVCKAVGILFSVASGLPCGKEGPMIHSGAAIASGVATGKSTKLKCDTGMFREFRDDKHKRAFVTAGAAAGVGAAFGAPVGGLLFAVEEVGSFWSLDLTVKVFVCSAITPWVLQFLLNPAVYQNAQIRGLIDFGQVKGEYNYNEIPFVILLGIFGGLIGAAFIASNIVLTKWRRKYVTTKFARFLEVLVVNALTSTVLILLVLRGYTCVSNEGVRAEVLDSLKSYGCDPGYHNDMATYFFRSMEDSISVLIHTEQEIPTRTLLMQMLPYFALTVLTYGIYVPSGLFLPTLALGASFGHLYAQTWNSITGDTLHLDPARFAVYGGTAVLGGVVRMTISVIVIIMEATGNTSIFYPLVMITVAAKFVGDKFTHGVYEAHLELNNIPLLDNKLESIEYTKLAAEQVMQQDIVVVPRVVTVRHLKKVLRRTPFDNAIVVTDPDTDRFVGLMLRRAAIILIANNAYRERLDLHHFVKSDKERALFRVRKSGILEYEPEDAERAIDLRPYIDQWPHTVQRTTPLPRVFRTFRELGLRHIVVLDVERKPVGLIGRKQLTHLHPVRPGIEIDEAPRHPDADDDFPGSDRMVDSTWNLGESSSGSPVRSGVAGLPSGKQTSAAVNAGSSTIANSVGGNAGNTSARTVSPTTSVRHRRVLTADEVMTSLRTRLRDDDEGDDWQDPHVKNVT